MERILLRVHLGDGVRLVLVVEALKVQIDTAILKRRGRQDNLVRTRGEVAFEHGPFRLVRVYVGVELPLASVGLAVALLNPNDVSHLVQMRQMTFLATVEGDEGVGVYYELRLLVLAGKALVSFHLDRGSLVETLVDYLEVEHPDVILGVSRRDFRDHAKDVDRLMMVRHGLP